MKKWSIKVAIVFVVTGGVLISLIKNESALGNKYFFLPMYEAIDVGFPNGSIIYKSNEKYLFSDIKINGDVIDIKSNRRFIIVMRKPRIKKNVKSYFKNTFGGDSIEYYIIEKKIDLIEGPLSKKKFLEMKKQLGISKTLKFD